jgi:hypothetical protein
MRLINNFCKLLKYQIGKWLNCSEE